MATPQETQIFGTLPSKAARVTAKSKQKFFKGISYPLGRLLTKRPLGNLVKNQNVNYFAQATDLQLVKGMVRQLLLTRKGERIMNPSFGLKLDHFVFEPLDVTTFELIKSEIINQIKVFLPFVEITRIKIFGSDQIGGHTLFVRLGLRIKNLSLLAPFEVEVRL